jgi:superfamily I DNA/RNA helicase
VSLVGKRRRLRYVSLTRARKFLFVTFARMRRGLQSHRSQVSERRTYTRFLRTRTSLPPGLLKVISLPRAHVSTRSFAGIYV